MTQANLSSAAQRIHALLDEKSFVEIGAYVRARNTDFNMAEIDTPADGVLTGYGTVNGNLVYVYSQDSSVLGGSMGEMHARKITNLYSQAMKMGAPIIGLIDCAGLRLQEATDALDAFGKLYLAQTMASGVIPQIQAVFGYSGGGMAVSAALSDFTFMEEKKAKFFINSPNVINGNYESKCDTSSAKFQASEAGTIDFIGKEEDILKKVRELVCLIPANNEDDMSYEECRDDLNRLVPEIENFLGEAKLFAASISDENYVYELKKDYAPDMFTGFIKLNGNTVAVLANRAEIYNEETGEREELAAVLSERGVKKATDFINFCDAFAVPVLTLVNVSGYKASKCTEKRMAREVAKLTFAFANATVAKVSIITGKAFGSAGLSMNSKSIGADLVFAYENSAIGMMPAKEAVNIIYAKEIEKADEQGKFISEKTAEYESLQASAISAARRGYVDDIISYQDTRKRLVAAFEMLFTKREERPNKKHGTV